MTTQSSKPLNERWIIALIGAVQFVNVLDFMMVMPLGPDFARALGIPVSQLGMIGGSYTASAAVSGLVGSLFLDRFDRRKALFWAMLGLAIGTIAGGFATDFHTLMLARILAGAFGGPATAISMSIIADVVPPARRGRAMGAVMGAFSLASIFGVPAGLEMARLGGWRLPFFAVGGLGFLVMLSAIALLPPMRRHLEAKLAREKAGEAPASLKSMMRPEAWMSYVMMAIAMLAAFMIIPNFSAFLQFNLGYPREDIGKLYLAGGTGSFIAMRIAGKLIDRFSAFAVACVSAALIIAVLYLGFILAPTPLPVVAIFAGFMVSMSIRGVTVQSLTSRVPSPAERARYMSFQSAITHFASAGGAMLSTQILTELPSGALDGVPRLATASIVLSVLIPVMVHQIEQRVRGREKRALEDAMRPADARHGGEVLA